MDDETFIFANKVLSENDTLEFKKFLADLRAKSYLALIINENYYGPDSSGRADGY